MNTLGPSEPESLHPSFPGSDPVREAAAASAAESWLLQRVAERLDPSSHPMEAAYAAGILHRHCRLPRGPVRTALARWVSGWSDDQARSTEGMAVARVGQLHVLLEDLAWLTQSEECSSEEFEADLQYLALERDALQGVLVLLRMTRQWQGLDLALTHMDEKASVLALSWHRFSTDEQLRHAALLDSTVWWGQVVTE